MELTLKQKTAFGIGAVGKDMVYALSASYVMYYYQDVLGLSASFVGIVLMAARFFDAFNDPFMGVLVAKTRTRWGRFRPWIFSGTLLNALVLYALFAAPVLDEAALMVYFSVVYILWGGEVSDSAETIAHKTDTISYEVLCGVSRRVPRVYLENGGIKAVEDWIL